jgi:hypothetical protein
MSSKIICYVVIQVRQNFHVLEDCVSGERSGLPVGAPPGNYKLEEYNVDLLYNNSGIIIIIIIIIIITPSHCGAIGLGVLITLRFPIT